MIFRFWQEVSIPYIVRVHDNLQHSNSIYIHIHKIFYAWHIMIQNLNINIISTLQLTFRIVWHYECMIFSLNFNKVILCQYSLSYKKKKPSRKDSIRYNRWSVEAKMALNAIESGTSQPKHRLHKQSLNCKQKDLVILLNKQAACKYQSLRRNSRYRNAITILLHRNRTRFRCYSYMNAIILHSFGLLAIEYEY